MDPGITAMGLFGIGFWLLVIRWAVAHGGADSANDTYRDQGSLD